MAKKKENLNTENKDSLKTELAKLTEHLRVLRFKTEGGKSKNVKEISNLKKQIARILTELNKK